MGMESPFFGAVIRYAGYFYTGGKDMKIRYRISKNIIHDEDAPFVIFPEVHVHTVED